MRQMPCPGPLAGSQHAVSDRPECPPQRSPEDLPPFSPCPSFPASGSGSIDCNRSIRAGGARAPHLHMAVHAAAVPPRRAPRRSRPAAPFAENRAAEARSALALISGARYPLLIASPALVYQLAPRHAGTLFDPLRPFQLLRKDVQQRDVVDRFFSRVGVEPMRPRITKRQKCTLKHVHQALLFALV